MSLLQFGIATVAYVRLPRVVRYMDEQWVDRFLEVGTLRLTSFRRCAKHDDDQRKDAREGRLSMQATAPDGSTLTAIVLPRPNLYMLCGSTVLDTAHRDLFQVSSGLVISKPFEFAAEIARALPNCRCVAQGPCFYEPESVKRPRLSAPLFTEDPKGEEDAMKVEAAINRLDGLESLFTKPNEPFSRQHEYRCVWMMDKDAEDYLLVEAPSAARFCEKAVFTA